MKKRTFIAMGAAAILFLGAFVVYSLFSGVLLEKNGVWQKPEAEMNIWFGDKNIWFGDKAGNGLPSRNIPERELLMPGPADQVAIPDCGSSPPVRQVLAQRFLVQTEEGFPLPGACVRTFRLGKGDPAQEAVTADSGEVELSVHPGEEIRVEARGYLTKRFVLKDEPWAFPYTIVLEKAEDLLDGRVVDYLGQPVMGARVEMKHEKGYGRAETGENGEFELVGFAPPGTRYTAFFNVFHSSYCFLGQEQPVHVGPEEKEVRLVVHPWAKLNVHVLDPRGTPLAGALIRLAGPPGSRDRFRIPGCSNMLLHMHGFLGAQSQEERALGTVIDRVPPLLPLWLVLEQPGFQPMEVELGAFEPAEERTQTIYLTQQVGASEAVFQVLDPDGNPVCKAEAWLSWDKDGEGISRFRMDVNEQGLFRVIPRVEKWDLFVSAPGFAPLKQSFSSSSLETGILKLVLERSSCGIKIKVKDTEGRPFSNALVKIVEEEEKVYRESARTDGKGRVEFVGLDPGAGYEVFLGFGKPGQYFHKEDREEVPSPAVFRQVRPGGDALLFRLVAPASIHGYLRIKGLGTGKPVFLSLVDEQRPGDKPVFTVSTILGSDGAFSFNGLPPGSYHLWMPGIKEGDRFDRPLAAWPLREGARLRGVEVDPP